MSGGRRGLDASRVYRGTRTVDPALLQRIEAAAGATPAPGAPAALEVGADGSVRLVVERPGELDAATARDLLRRLEPVLRTLRERAEAEPRR